MSTRYERRQFKKKQASLQKESEVLRKRIAEIDHKLVRMDGASIENIENYVNMLSQALDLDETATTAFGHPLNVAISEDPKLYELIVATGWHDVKTVEEAKAEVKNEIALRSVSKSDMALLLSSIDHTASHLHNNLPEHLKDLHGDELAIAAFNRLETEDFGSDLVQDKKWVAMRTRWLRMGWQGATDENSFNTAFIKAVAERIATYDRNQAECDTVLDEELKKMPPSKRQAAMFGFKERLRKEYARLPSQRNVAEDPRRANLKELLLTIDTIAFDACRNMPEQFKLLHGKELLDESLRSYKIEAPTQDYMINGVGWAKMREHWVHIGWRNATLETFNALFIQATIERMVDMHDTEITDEDETFRDYIKRMGGPLREAYNEVIETRITHELNRIIRLRPVPLEPEGVSAVTPAGLPSAHKTGSIRINYSDHELMRRGRQIWEVSYAEDMDDEEVRDGIGKLNAVEGFTDDLALFSAKWAVHAFQRLMTSHTFAAALMCSDVQKEVLEDIEKQWDAFLVLVPTGMLMMPVVGGQQFEFTRVLVATYSYGARIILLTTRDKTSTEEPFVGTVMDEAPTLADLLASDAADLDIHSATRRCLVMAKRLIAGLLLNLQHEPNFKIRQVEARPKSLKRLAEPEHRIVTIGKPLEIDCRAAVKEYIEHGPAKGRKHSPPTVQVMVRGHYRRQVCGVGRLERKVIWIEPFWRGPEAALIQTRAKVPSAGGPAKAAQ